MTDKQKQRMLDDVEDTVISYQKDYHRLALEICKESYREGYQARDAEPCGGCAELVDALEDALKNLYIEEQERRKDGEIIWANAIQAKYKKHLAVLEKHHAQSQANKGAE